MAYLDEDEDLDALDDGTIGGMMRRSELRERARERARMEAPSAMAEREEWNPAANGEALLRGDEEEARARAARDEARAPARAEAARIMEEYDRAHAAPSPPEPADAAPSAEADPLDGMDLSALDNLEENARGAATDPLGVDIALDEPDADEGGAEPDNDADDLGTLGAAMDHNPAAPSRERVPEPPSLSTMTPEEADASYAARLAERGDRWAPLSGLNVGELMPEPVAFGDVPLGHPEPDTDEAGGPSDGDADDLDVSSIAEAPAPAEGVRITPVAGADPDEVDEIDPADRWSDDADAGTEFMPTDPTPASMEIARDAAATMDEGDDEPLDVAALDEEPEKAPTPGRDPSGALPMDVGLPSEADHAWGVARDVIATPFRLLGAGLAGALGRPRPEHVMHGPAAAEARAAGLRERSATKTATATAAREAAAESDRYALDRASRERIAGARLDFDRDREARVADRDRLRTDLMARRATSAEADAQSRIADRASRADARDRSSDPDSDVSSRARERLPAMLAGIRDPGLAEAVGPLLLGPDAPAWSADDVEAFEGYSTAAWRAWLSRASAAGGGGGGIDREAYQAELERLGVPRSQTDLMSATQLRDALDEMTGSGAPDATPAGDYLVPGVPMSMVTDSEMSGASRERVRRSYEIYRRGMEAMNYLEDFHRRYGVEGVVRPEYRAEAEAALSQLMSMVADVRDIGVIQIGEMPSVLQTLPDPTSVTGVTLDRFFGSLRGWRSTLDSAAEAAIAVRTNNNPEAIRGAMEWVRGGGGGAARSRGTIIRDPETGEEMDGAGLSDEELAAFEAEGFEVER